MYAHGTPPVPTISPTRMDGKVPVIQNRDLGCWNSGVLAFGQARNDIAVLPNTTQRVRVLIIVVASEGSRGLGRAWQSPRSAPSAAHRPTPTVYSPWVKAGS